MNILQPWELLDNKDKDKNMRKDEDKDKDQDKDEHTPALRAIRQQG